MNSPSRFLCVLVGFLVVMGIGRAVFGETEPNNDIANANAVSLNEPVDGSLNSVDSNDTVDCFAFTLPQDGYFQLGVVPTSGLNVDITLKDTDGVADLAYKNDTGNGGTEGILYPNLRAGTYYVLICVPLASNPMQGTYSASFNFMPLEESLDPEPNDTPIQASDISPNGDVTGHIGYYGDKLTDNHDFYRVTIPSDGKLELTVYPDKTANLALALYDSVIHNNLVWRDNNGNGVSEKIVYSNLAAGTYNVLVYRIDGYCSYNLTSLFTANDTPEAEPNDSTATAVEVNITGTASVQGRMGYEGNQYRDDNDYFKVTIPDYGKLTLSSKMDSGENLGVGFQLWDSSLRYLGGGGTYSDLDAGVYFIRMYRNSGYGSYTLTMTFESAPAPVPVSAPAAVLSPNGKIDQIAISSDSPEQWFNVNLPEDGAFTVKMNFESTVYVYMGLFDEKGVTRRANDVYAYFTTDERTISVPNMRKGNYKVKLWRSDKAGVGSLTSEFVPVTKLDDESNDDYTSLKPIAYNQSYVGHMGYSGNGWNDNLDLYLLDIPEDGSLTVTATFASTAYNYLTLFSSDGNAYTQLSQTYGYFTTEPRSVGKPNILAGKYLVQISRNDGYGEYDFTVDFVPNRSNDLDVNGNDWVNPLEITLGQGYIGHIGYDRNFFMDTADYYKVILPEDGSFYATFQSASSGYIYWRLYQADFKTKVAESYSYFTEDTRTIGSPSLRAGTYFISIDRSDRYATYQFYTAFTPQAFTDPDLNYAASQAVEMPFNTVMQGAIGYGNLAYRDPVDWYQVTVPEKGRYGLAFHATNTSYFYFELYGSNMVSRHSSDYRYFNTDPFVRELDLEAGTYYVR